MSDETPANGTPGASFYAPDWQAEIAALRAEVERLRAVLRGAVELIEQIDWLAFSLADAAKLKAARRALEGKP